MRGGLADGTGPPRVPHAWGSLLPKSTSLSKLCPRPKPQVPVSQGGGQRGVPAGGLSGDRKTSPVHLRADGTRKQHQTSRQSALGRWCSDSQGLGRVRDRGRSSEGLSTQPPAGLGSGPGVPLPPQPPALWSGSLQPRPSHSWPPPPGRGPLNPKFVVASVCVFLPGQGSRRRQRRHQKEF